MEAEHIFLYKILGANNQFEVPIYQRTYDWGIKQCNQFYDDVVKIDKTNKDHFIGAITYATTTMPLDVNVAVYQIIDGQQRLTTLMLLLSALRESLDNHAEHVIKNATKQRIDKLLFNANGEEEDGEHYYKLILTEDDNKILKDIMKDGKSESSNNITTNYRHFVSRLRKDGTNPDIIWEGIRKLTMVGILIDEKDDAQAIFESMNSTGLDLSATDMIQNYLLMSDLEQQKHIYQEFWRPMEENFGEDQTNFEEFIRNYLMMHLKERVNRNSDAIYENFKKRMAELGLDKAKETEKMCKYSEYYAKLIGIRQLSSNMLKDTQVEDLKDLEPVIKHIDDHGISDANPLLLKLLVDCGDGIITKEECKQAFLLIDSYLVRCHVCGTNKGGNKIFPAIIPKIIGSDYVKSIEKILVSKGGRNAFPRDDAFKENLERLQLYRKNAKYFCRYMITRLEHATGKEKVDLDDLTIEHIMPQSLRPEWKSDLGSDWKGVHEKYLNTIGNLTLTGYNPDMGNKRFLDKLDTYKNSQVRLSRDLCQYNVWDENTIKARAESLSEEAVKLWEYPTGYDLDGQNTETVDADETDEEEHLDEKDSAELWYELKEKIIQSCPDELIFRMRKHYGTFSLRTTYSKNILICSIMALKNKITLTYNVKPADNILSPSGFVRNIATGHLASGDFVSTIMLKEDIDKAVEIVKKVYDYKK